MLRTKSELAPTERVFILGAGFSAACGMPVATELTRSLLQWRFLGEDQDFQAWVNNLHDRIQRMSAWAGKAISDAPNIEQLFDYAPFDRELYMMEQHLCQVGRYCGFETPFGLASRIQAWLDELVRGLTVLLVEWQHGASPAKIMPFAKHLRSADTVLTFNYDTILEQAIEETGASWCHGFEREGVERGLPILKLHGSLDWWMFPKQNVVNQNKWKLLYEKVDKNREQYTAECQERIDDDPEGMRRLYRAQDLGLAAGAFKQYDGMSIGPPPTPGLGGLGSHKSLHELLGSGEVWQRARWALREAREVYVIGWSCSEYDRIARLYFADTLASRKMPPERIDVVAPHASANIDRYKSVFKHPRPIDKRVEDVDWADFLSSAR